MTDYKFQSNRISRPKLHSFADATALSSARVNSLSVNWWSA
ncbi:MAG: hypothetical protein WC980_06495 [Candidatus Brocadiia bacterium]